MFTDVYYVYLLWYQTHVTERAQQEAIDQGHSGASHGGTAHCRRRCRQAQEQETQQRGTVTVGAGNNTTDNGEGNHGPSETEIT